MHHVPSIKCQCAKLDQYTDEVNVVDAGLIVKVFSRGEGTGNQALQA